MADDSRTKAMKELLNLTKELQTTYKSNLDIEKQVADLQERRSERQSLINQLQQNYNDLNNRQKGVLNNLIKLQNTEYDTLKKLSKQRCSVVFVSSGMYQIICRGLSMFCFPSRGCRLKIRRLSSIRIPGHHHVRRSTQ